MRPFEFILILGECVTFAAILFVNLRASPFVRYTIFAMLAMIPLQVLIEGPRWQLAPAYAFGGALFVAFMVLRRESHPSFGKEWRVRAIQIAGILFSAIWLLVSAVLPALVPVPHLPKPSGPYAIGTVTYHWVDQFRREEFSANPKAKRELMVQLWYPARDVPGAPHAPYLQPGTSLAPLAHLLHLPSFFFDHLKYVHTNAIESAPAAEGKFPVLIFLPGRGGFRQHNTFQVEELVSHGYAVAAVDEPYAVSEVLFPDGRRVDFDPRMADRSFMRGRIAYIAADASFALDRLKSIETSDPARILTGHLDLDHAGVFGASLGGEVTTEACHLDARFRACLVLDGFAPSDVVRSGLSQPVMWISRDEATMRREGWKNADIEELQTSMRAVYDKKHSDAYLVLVPGMYHANIADFPYLVWTPLARSLGFIGPIDWHRAHAIINAYSLAFFDRYLKGAHEPLLGGPSKRFPDVQLEARP